MNINNEILINAFKEEMARSNHNSKWWEEHLSEQITNLFGNSLESSIKDAIMSSAKTYIDSGSLATSQFFYNTKELSDKKMIFAGAKYNEQNNIFNQINKDDKQAIINNNEHLKINDIYNLLTVSEIESENKKEIANLLDDSKIKELKENYSDLDELLKTWLGERYNQLFEKIELKEESIIKEEPKENKTPQPNINTSPKKIEENILTKYNNATDKIQFFNNIFRMEDKLDLFSKLNDREKSNILNDENTQFLTAFYNNYQNKDELLNLMNQDTIKNFYNISGPLNKESISNYLYNKEQNLKNTINQNVNDISKETENINQYNIEINKSKENKINLKNEKKEIKLNIKNSKITIKQLEKRKAKLEKKLANTILKKESKISVISKKRLEKIQRLTNEINLNSIDLNSEIERKQNYQQRLETIEENIEQERKNISDNKNKIVLASQKIESYAREMSNSKVQVKEVSAFHKELAGKKVYNHNKNNMIMTTSKEKTNIITNTSTSNTNEVDKKSEDTKKINETSNKTATNNQVDNTRLNTLKEERQKALLVGDNMAVAAIDREISKEEPKNKSTNETKQSSLPNNSNDANLNISTPPKSKVSQNQRKVEEELNKVGIPYNFEEIVEKEQNSSYLPPEAITSMTYNQAKMMQLYFEAEYAKKMAEIAKLQQQIAMGGRSRTLSKAGFSNVAILISTLSILTLIGMIIFLVVK